MKKLKFVTQYNYDSKSIKNEKILGVSLTQPSQAYSISEILEKFVSGQQLLISKNGIYDDDDDIDYDDITRDPSVDITDISNELTVVNSRLLAEKDKAKIEKEKAHDLANEGKKAPSETPVQEGGA